MTWIRMKYLMARPLALLGVAMTKHGERLYRRFNLCSRCGRSRWYGRPCV